MASESPYPIPTINLPPGFVPKTPTDFELLQIIHQIQTGHASLFDLYLLGQLLNFPFIPIQVKLNIYHFMVSLPFIQAIHLSPLWFSILSLFMPGITIMALIFMVIVAVVLKGQLPKIIGFIASKVIKKENSLVFLELTFPHDSIKSAYATEQLYILIHSLARQKSLKERIAGQKKLFSLEIVASKEAGIRYIVATPSNYSEIIRRSILSYLPNVKIREVKDYLNPNNLNPSNMSEILELKLSGHFALPLTEQKTLEEHDPISYLTGHMTKLKPDELISFQVITTPVLTYTHRSAIKKINQLTTRMYRGLPLAPVLKENIFQRIAELPILTIPMIFLKINFLIVRVSLSFVLNMVLVFADSDGKMLPFLMTNQVLSKVNSREILNLYEQELQGVS